LVAVSDLSDYVWCERSVWIKRRLGIKTPKSKDKTEGLQFHLLIKGLYEQLKKAFNIDLPGRLIEAELLLPRNASSNEVFGLVGRLDALRQAAEGYVISDYKFTQPPREERVYPTHKVQLDAYAFLAEKDGYRPVKACYILYNDLIPREVAPETSRIPPLINKVEKVLTNDFLPRKGEKCEYCGYSSLCAVLPENGGLTAGEILGLKRKEREEIIARFESKT
jgi:CRISPR-associated protein Cas4